MGKTNISNNLAVSATSAFYDLDQPSFAPIYCSKHFTLYGSIEPCCSLRMPFIALLSAFACILNGFVSHLNCLASLSGVAQITFPAGSLSRTTVYPLPLPPPFISSVTFSQHIKISKLVFISFVIPSSPSLA